ncbi:MAG: LacI family DNA-binding transcriptional regulator [Verrucomicrobiota bacterium]
MATGKKRVTIGDVARRAKVSRAAVSYALRDDPNIAPATRARIRKVADAMGYRPDPTLAKLMAHLHAGGAGRYAGKLALLNVHPTAPDYFRDTPALVDFADSAAGRAAELGYDTEAFWLHEPGRSPRRLAQMLVARGIRGLLVGSTGRHGSVLEFPWEKFSAVTVGYSVETPALHRVVTHHYRNTQLAIRRALAAGHTRLGFMSPACAEATMENLHLAAFLAWQHEARPEDRVPPLLVDSGEWGALRTWFQAHRPTVILGTSAGRVELAAAGIRVPDDVALVKLLLWDPGLGESGVLPGYERLGEAAVNLLVGPLQHDDYGVPEDPKVVLIDGRWSDGATLVAPSNCIE